MKKRIKQYVIPEPGQRFKNGCGMDVVVEKIYPNYIRLRIISNPTSHHGPVDLCYGVSLNGRLENSSGDTRYDITISREKASKRSRLY